MNYRNTIVSRIAPVQLWKRRMAARIYERLVNECGFTGGESTVHHYMRKLKAPLPECFLKLEASPGEQIQIDFGHVEVNIGGQRIRVYLFCMRFKYSLVPKDMEPIYLVLQARYLRKCDIVKLFYSSASFVN